MGLAAPSHRPTNFPYTQHTNQDSTAIDVGGPCLLMIAAAALKIGDAVYVDSAGKAAKSTTIANYLNFAGVVIGGADLDMNVFTDPAMIGAVAASAGAIAIIAQPGAIVYGVVGAATTTRGSRITADAATAGRVRAQAASSTAYTIGTALETVATAGAAVKILLTGVVSVTLA